MHNDRNWLRKRQRRRGEDVGERREMLCQLAVKGSLIKWATPPEVYCGDRGHVYTGQELMYIILDFSHHLSGTMKECI